MLATRKAVIELSVRRAETAEDKAGLQTLRLEVFVTEQGVPRELEMDALDATAIHAVATEGGAVVGTGRLILTAPGAAQIGRMAVRQSARRRGIGGQILLFLEAEAANSGVRSVELHAQRYVSAFYRRHGYAEEGGPFVEAGIEHVLMRKMLVGPDRPDA